MANAYGSTRAVDAAELTDPATGTTRKVRGDYSVSYPWAQAGSKEFTGEEWGQSKYYNLSIDTTHLSYQQAADLILYYKKLAEEAQK